MDDPNPALDPVLDPQQRHLLDIVNQSMENQKQRRWMVRVFFGLTKMKDHKGRRLKGVGIYRFRPGAITSIEHEITMGMKDREEAEATKDELRRLTSLMEDERRWLLDEVEGPSGMPRITFQSLITEITKTWNEAPVNTQGDVDLWYERVYIRVPREKMLETAPRERLMGFAKEIVNRMDKEIFYDSFLGAHRKVDERGTGAWVLKR